MNHLSFKIMGDSLNEKRNPLLIHLVEEYFYICDRIWSVYVCTVKLEVSCVELN